MCQFAHTMKTPSVTVVPKVDISQIVHYMSTFSSWYAINCLHKVANNHYYCVYTLQDTEESSTLLL